MNQLRINIKGYAKLTRLLRQFVLVLFKASKSEFADPRGGSSSPGISAVATARIVSGAALSVPHVRYYLCSEKLGIKIQCKKRELTNGALGPPPATAKKHAAYLIYA